MYTNIELFAGAWWLALWIEKAGFNHILLNDFDKYAIATLKRNRPLRNIIQGDIHNIDFTPFYGVDLLSWGYPCQSFSYAWKQLGLEDIRGTLFLEFARAIKETQPKMFLAENVAWLKSHDWWKTLQTMLKVFSELWYEVIEPRVLRAIYYNVPQKRERIFIIWIRKDLYSPSCFSRPIPSSKILTLKDALKAGMLYPTDVPCSEWQQYPSRKKEILNLVPPWGYWKDLPLELQKEYMQWSFFLGGGKTWIARRISWDEPCLTLTCSPAQKQTERCHPEEIRPFTIREYARIQTFPDEWIFEGSISQQYKQIWNAVPVNLSYAIALSIKSTLDKISSI